MLWLLLACTQSPAELDLGPTLWMRPRASSEGGDLWLRRGEGADRRWLGPCAGGLCWNEAPVHLPAELLSPLEEPVVEAELGSGDPEGPGSPALLLSPTVELWWGDLHSHSNLSQDGCEDRNHSCLPAEGRPGARTFELALEHGLDFAAITEHAEYSTWTDLESGQTVDIWAEQQALAAEVEGGALIPLVGYEWTASYEGGGHRTVLFEDLSPCAELRISSQVRVDRTRLNGIEAYTGADGPMGRSPPELLDLIERGREIEGCADGRVYSYFHHPAWSLPADVDWHNPLNQGLGDRVLEIYSEHGSSECADREQEGCTWRNRGIHYRGDGSAQRALQEGLRLGFVGGTDNHEGDPGGILDGPSWFFGNEGLRIQSNSGGLAGLMVPLDSPRDRGSLMDALHRRHSIAASHRPDSLSVLALGADDRLYLPGDDLPEEALPARVLAEVDEEEALTLHWELVDAWGDLRGASDGPSVELELWPLPGEAIYLRLRMGMAEDEERIWLSPWFGPG